MVVRGGVLLAVPALDLEMLRVELVEGWEGDIDSLHQLDKLEHLVDRAFDQVREGVCVSGSGGGGGAV